MTGRDEAEHVHVLTPEEWRDWLHANHERSSGAWLVFWRSGTGRPRLSYEDAVLEALCFGWIDGQARPLDEERTMLWFVPRSPRSAWSRVNKERVALLEREGRLRPAGIRAIELARSNGTWSVLDDADQMIVPDDFVAALDARPPARENWDSFPPSVKKNILSGFATAKKAETRQSRIAKAVENAQRGERGI